jgi:hypothetical protein
MESKRVTRENVEAYAEASFQRLESGRYTHDFSRGNPTRSEFISWALWKIANDDFCFRTSGFAEWDDVKWELTFWEWKDEEASLTRTEWEDHYRTIEKAI